jgi:NADH:ubiquinone reductase (H+-translocating)
MPMVRPSPSTVSSWRPARHGYFGHQEWAHFAPGLKTIDNATYLRRRILLAFERAEIEPDAGELRRLLNFVVVGGGPTGVEMASAIAELAKRAGLSVHWSAVCPHFLGGSRLTTAAGVRLLTIGGCSPLARAAG